MKIQTSFYSLDCEGFEHWNKFFPDISPENATDILLQGLPYSDVNLILDDDRGNLQIHSDGSYISTQTLKPEKKLVVDGGVMVFSEGQSFGKRLMSNRLALFEKAGYETFRLEASQVGSYLWAKMGFLPRENQLGYISKRVAMRSAFLRPYLEKQHQTSLDRVSSISCPEDIWKIADCDISIDLPSADSEISLISGIRQYYNLRSIGVTRDDMRRDISSVFGAPSRRTLTLGQYLLSHVSWGGEFSFSSEDQKKRLSDFRLGLGEGRNGELNHRIDHPVGEDFTF